MVADIWVTIVITKKEVIQLRMEGSNTEEEAKIPLATIVLRPHAFEICLSLFLLWGNGRWERTNRSKENKKLEESDFEISARNDGYGSYNNNNIHKERTQSNYDHI